ncbi:MAG TPA: XisH protein [Cyanobacteria bacterium UBA11368]|nr:XisH protein [Cyanobacteria bacterium UBA11368]
MPARDVYHQAVKFALIKDDWTILAEDYVLQYGEDKVYADIAAEQTIAAQKQGRKIIVEVKSFLGRSFINDLEGAVGQYVIYRDILEETNSDFKIYLAITKAVYKNNFQRKLAQTILKRNQINLLIIEPENEVIEQWIE